MDSVLVISEEAAHSLVGIEDAIEAVERAFVAMQRGDARNYPVVREAVGHRDAVFGVKTGADAQRPLLGLKACGYWPHNAAAGRTNHQSATLLFDPDTGRARALVSANYLTGLRTGAASAIASKHLARADSSVLGILGTGAQAIHQVRATLAVRAITRVLAWDPSAENLRDFGRAVEQLGLAFEPQAGAETVVTGADILVTVTTARRPLVRRDWVRPGLHINAMGADTKGKQEMDPDIVVHAAVFVDEPLQALEIGECQHAHGLGFITEAHLRGTLGAVVAGRCEGRRDEREITLFDGTGVALQDLAVAELAVRLAEERGAGQRVEY